MTSTPADENKKITSVKTIYEATEVSRRTVEQVSAYTNKAMDALQQSTLSLINCLFYCVCRRINGSHQIGV